MADIESITSIENETLKRVRRLLKSRRARAEESAFVLEGLNSVGMLLDPRQTRLRPELFMISESLARTADGKSLLERSQSVRRIMLADDLMERSQDVRTSQGVMAIAEIPAIVETPGDRGHYILLDRISDPGNMGTLIRTAVGTGIDGILLYGECVDIYNPKCVRASAGMLPFINVASIDQSALKALLAKDYDLLVAQRDIGCDIFDSRFADKCIIAIGNEAHGLSSELRTLATGGVHIPLVPICESLNAAVAGSMIMLVLSRLKRTGLACLFS